MHHWRPSAQLLRWSGHWWRHVPLVRHNLRARRFTIRGRAILLGHKVPTWLPIQAPQDFLPDQGLSSQHQLAREHLLRHSQGSLESSIDYLKNLAFNLQLAVWCWAKWPIGPGHCSPIQDRPGQVWRKRQGMDQEIRLLTFGGRPTGIRKKNYDE